MEKHKPTFLHLVPPLARFSMMMMMIMMKMMMTILMIVTMIMTIMISNLQLSGQQSTGHPGAPDQPSVA